MANEVREIRITKKVSLKGSHKGRQRAHNHATGKYVRQRTRTEVNKLRSRKRHLANHPNDKQAKIALSGLV